MPFCRSCGNEHVTGVAYCSACGSSLNVAAIQTMPMAALGVGPVTTPGLVGARFIGQWNWGAALLTPYWLMTHRRVAHGVIWLIVSLIPYINIATLGCLIYYGLNGNRIAVLCGRFTDEAQFVAVENAWRNWALGLLVVFLGLPLLFLIGAGVYNAYR